MAESGGNTTATHINSDGTIDYGLWQINSVHSQYSQQLLISNPAYNAQAAFQISNSGSNFVPWTTYKTGAYTQFLGASITGSTTSTKTVDQVFSQRGLWKWYADRVTNVFNGSTEKGEDFSTTWGTPVGIIVGGTVVRAVHNNNSVGDVVEIQASDTSVYLYQHIRRNVTVGQKVATGDVVGTEDGLPRDQYSTGPHIEVRYCQPGRWSSLIDSWNEPWVDPRNVFSKAGSYPASTSSSSSVVSYFGNISPTTSGSYIPLTARVHQTLINTPGFYGMALSVDEAEQFPGWIDLADHNAGPVPDIVGMTRSIGATVSDNFIPFAIRSGLVIIGGVLLFMLLSKPVLSAASSMDLSSMEAIA